MESPLKFPFVTRARYEEEVARLKDQIKGLAMRVYPEGVPEEAQLVLGIRVEAKPAQVQSEPEMTDDEKAVAQMKADQANDKANLERIRRTRPSLLGKAMADYMQKWGTATFGVSAKVASSPVAKLFADAEADALKTIPEA